MKIAINALAMRSYDHGMGRYIGNLVNALIRIDDRNEYILYVSSQNRKYFSLSPEKKVTFKIIDYPNYLRIFWEQLVLPLDLKRKKVDVFFGPAFIAPLCKNTKQLITIHDMTWFVTPKTHLLVKIIYFQTMLFLLVKKVDLIFSDSESTTEDITKILKVPSSKIKTVLLGIEEKFRVVSDHNISEHVSQKYRLPKKFIFFLGVLEPRKNVEGLIRAFAICREMLNKQLSGYQDLKLVISGGRSYGWKNKEIFQLIKDLRMDEEIILTDFVNEKDLPALYGLSDLFMLPSFYEGFGLPILEAQACGCPVITSNVSSMPEVGGNAAYYINPHNEKEIAEAMYKVLIDRKLRTEMVKNGFENLKRFSWEKTARETLKTFEEVYKKA